MSDLDCEIVTTRGGATAILDKTTMEVMHPVVGPLVEPHQIYVGPSRLAERLVEETADALVVLDVGLGAGSTAVAFLQTALGAAKQGRARHLQLYSFDRDLGALELALQPAHRGAFGFDGEIGELADSLAKDGVANHSAVTWHLEQGSLPEALKPAGAADIIFWDMFSPRTDLSVWSAAAFARARQMCRAGATLHTFSSATSTRTALLLGGFHVGVGASSGTGRPTTAAATELKDLQEPLGRRFFERLTRSSAPFPADAPADALERLREMPQFA